jgi:hypothetical protein
LNESRRDNDIMERESGRELDGKVVEPVWVIGSVCPLPTMILEEVVMGEEAERFPG